MFSTLWKIGVVALLCASATWAAAPARLALDLSAEGRHEPAAIEFRRLALADPDAVQSAGWFWLAAREYAQGAEREQSDKMLDRAEDAAPRELSAPTTWLRAENALAGRDWDSAAFHFDSLRLKADADDLREFAARGAAAAHLRDRDPAAARHAVEQSQGEGRAHGGGLSCRRSGP